MHCILCTNRNKMNEPLYVINKYVFIKFKFNFIVYDMDSGIIFHITELLLYLFSSLSASNASHYERL